MPTAILHKPTDAAPLCQSGNVVLEQVTVNRVRCVHCGAVEYLANGTLFDRAIYRTDELSLDHRRCSVQAVPS